MTDQIVKQKQKKVQKHSQVLLGVDYGEAKIGIAFGREGTVMPLDIIQTRDSLTAIKHIADATVKNHVTKIIVGLPLSEDEKENAQSHSVRRFAKLLKHYVKIPVEFMNEYGTSKEANGYLLALGSTRHKRDLNDSISAALILRDYYRVQEELNPDLTT